MHMADALLSPAVGGVMIAASGAALAISARKLREEADDRKVPLMGVMGAFIFAAQMLNFTIPGTGSSGHLLGGVLLTMLLGPWAALITLASVIVVQALFFADGGILALGANIWNMGVYTCFGGWLIYKAIAGKNPGRVAVSLAAVCAAVISMELGALSVALETVLSGRSELPFGEFALLMAGIHLPISLIEGLATVVVVNFVLRIRPELVRQTLGMKPEDAHAISYRPVLAAFAIFAVIMAGGLAWFASSHPDGLEWSIEKIYGKTELPAGEGGVEQKLSDLQGRTSILPDYGFKSDEEPEGDEPKTETTAEEPWPAVSAGTSLSGLIGSALVLTLVGALGLLMVGLRGKAKPG